MLVAEQQNTPADKPLQSWRCHNCGSKLAEIKLSTGTVIAIKCSRCNAMNVREAA